MTTRSSVRADSLSGGLDPRYRDSEPERSVSAVADQAAPRSAFRGAEDARAAILRVRILRAHPFVPAIPVEYASHRKIRERNKLYYRFNHWPIWIFVFFIAPGPLTLDLFERGFDSRMALWLAAVLIGTGIAGLRGRLPGVEARPYIIRFTEDRPNPLYRRVCYTFAWSEVITFAVLNVTGLAIAIATGGWQSEDVAAVPHRVLSRWLARSGCSARSVSCRA